MAAFYLAESSTNYWETWFQSPPGGEEEDDGPANAIITFDCVGYLVGWFNAWANDQGPNYSNSDADQIRRIKAGGQAAAGASMMRGLALRFK